MRTRNIKINVYLNETENRMLEENLLKQNYLNLFLLGNWLIILK